MIRVGLLIEAGVVFFVGSDVGLIVVAVVEFNGLLAGAGVGLIVGCMKWLPLAVQCKLRKLFYDSIGATINSMDLFRNKVCDL